MQAHLNPARISSLNTCLARFKLDRHLSVNTCRRLLGLMAAASPVLPLGFLHMRLFFWWMKPLGFRSTGPATCLIRVPRSCFRTLLIWQKPLFVQSGVRMGEIHHRQMVTRDASLTGWGAVFQGRPACRVWTGELLSWHINGLELRAVFLAPIHFLPSLKGCHVIVSTDNMAVESHINRQGGFTVAHPKQACTPSPPLDSRQVPLLESGSCSGSLELRSGEWMLTHQTLAQIWDLFGKAEGDLFASLESTQCPLLFSLSSPAPLGIDAFAQPWPDMRLYSFPPVKLIPAVLCRVKETAVRLLLIFPFWPSQMWFSELIPLLYRPPWEILIRQDLLSQLWGKIWH